MRMWRKLFVIVAIAIFSLLSLGGLYLNSPMVLVAHATIDNREFVLDAPYKLDQAGYLNIDGILGMLQHRWPPADPDAICSGTGAPYEYVYGRGWPMHYMYQVGLCSPMRQLVMVPLFLDFLCFCGMYSVIVWLTYSIIRHRRHRRSMQSSP